MRRLAIFDLDGTLVDSRRDLADAGNAARSALGLSSLPVDAVVPMIGDGASKLIERLTPGCDAEQRRQAMAAFMADYATRLTHHTACYPGISDLLAGLRQRGWLIAIATNKPSLFALPICRGLGLDHDALRGGDGPKKPDPTMLENLIAETRAERSQTWMIGDHHTDLQAGAAAGVRTVHCTWGFGQRGGATADAVAQSPSDVLRILDA